MGIRFSHQILELKGRTLEITIATQKARCIYVFAETVSYLWENSSRKGSSHLMGKSVSTVNIFNC